MARRKVQQPYDPETARRMTFWQHMGELRTRIFRCLFYVLVLAGAAWFFRLQILDLITWPLHQSHPEVELNVLSVQEAFMFYMRLAIYSAVVVASPLILLEAWGFISPALKPQERRMAMPVLPLILFLFIGGVLFIYFQLVPASVDILLGIAEERFEVMLTVDYYVNFVLGLCMAGGIMFEMPIVLGLLGYLEFVTARGLWQRSNIAVVALLVLSAVITPTGDAFTMILFTLPLLVLYFASTLVVWLIERRLRSKQTSTG